MLRIFRNLYILGYNEHNILFECALHNNLNFKCIPIESNFFFGLYKLESEDK